MRHNKSILVAVAAGVCASAAISFPAAATATTVTLTSAQTVALFGNTIQCEYLANDGTYKTTTATYASSFTIGYDYAFSPDGQTFAGRQVVQYAIPYAQDINVTPSDITLYFETAVDISSLSYIDTAIVQLSNMDFSTQLFGTYNDYWYCSNGYNYALRAGASDTSAYNYYGYISSDNYYKYTVIPCLYSSAQNTTFSTGWAKCGSFKNATYNDNYYIGFVCPILSEDWRYTGNTGAGSGQSSGGGSDSSGAAVDLTGIISRLDTIVDKLDTIIDNQNSSSEDSTPDNSAPAHDTPSSIDSAIDNALLDAENYFSESSGVPAAAEMGSFLSFVYRIYQIFHLDTIFIFAAMISILAYFLYSKGG